ncbi:MAG TPA: endonuclease/exonuclease/phosphatase family protein [Burkholderiales bacterium]|nr:endonuclease/exonuclease/phosphatase family protein [Burkholderiales bacterium]
MSLLLVAMTALPFITTDAWWIRIFDFPRVQLAALLLASLIVYAILLVWRRSGMDFVMVALVMSCLVWQVYCIIPYTPLVSPAVQRSGRAGTQSAELRLMIVNVRYDNRRDQALLEVVRQNEPDLVLVMEPTAWWTQQLESLKQDYPHVVEQPQENHFGMILYSRLELIEPQVRFLVTNDVPSIRTRVKLARGETVWFYGLHPRPPGLHLPASDERADSTQRDTELVLIGREVADHERPVIVAGDFNDVAWSHTTALFGRLSGLLDPRIGRGLYSTYHAERPLLRYPLDHVFVSNDFRLAELRLLPYVGSDHFPIFVALNFEPAAANDQPEPQPQPGDHEEADEQLRKQHGEG